ncbi:fasciclin domain-containing protein [Photobacterium sp. SDRW27]|uniref:fasciclin domain-containing protein n=1 Tax=Photobacterium obscurum TaxID=2829490 RepID=UPI0022446978|nr:fasciclin domain-containing protein [Photobacterium obscurum]MCW8330730.1 fasciclin domain-containing protein [Photobacterium obscurum]
MKTVQRFFTSSFITLLLLSLSGLVTAAYQKGEKINLVEVAANNDDFQTLVMAIRAADLTGTLEGKGPFTLMAPTDDAFAKLPAGTLADLLKPENKEQLQAVLKYHLLIGAITSEEVSKLKLPETVQGETVQIESGEDGVTINGAKVIAGDLNASNGVIHVIDTVLIPGNLSSLTVAGYKKGEKINLVEVAATNDDFQTLVMAIRASGLTSTLEGKGPFTLMAPTDDAFAKLPAGTLADLLKPENKEQLQAVLKYHLLIGAFTSEAVSRLKLPETVQGGTVQIENGEDGVTINDAKLIAGDLNASNGVIHVIDTVLIPE